MAEPLKWCPNCNQNVSPQKDRGNRGCVFGVLLLLGIVLLFFGLIPGIIMLAVAFVYMVVGLLFEVATVASKGHCPICKGTNLMNSPP